MNKSELKKLLVNDEEDILIDRMFYHYCKYSDEILGNCRDGCCRCEYSLNEFLDEVVDEEDLEHIEVL